MRDYFSQQESTHLQNLDRYVKASYPVVRLEGGHIYARGWNFEPIMNCLRESSACRQAIVEKYPATLDNIGDEILKASLHNEAYQDIVANLKKFDLEKAVIYAKHLPQSSPLLVEVCERAIKARVNLYPVMDFLYHHQKPLYQQFKETEKATPSTTGLRCMITFFAKQIASSKTSKSDRLEFLTWVDILEKQLKYHTGEVGYLQKAYSELKTKDGAMAYLLKDVIMKYVPNILEPINIARGIFYYWLRNNFYLKEAFASFFCF